MDKVGGDSVSRAYLTQGKFPIQHLFQKNSDLHTGKKRTETEMDQYVAAFDQAITSAAGENS